MIYHFMNSSELTLTQGFVSFARGNASVKVALHGGTVVSWTIDGIEKLFVSSKSSQTGPAAIRGGIPVVFPCFGPPPKEEPFTKLKQHGFARTSLWQLEGQTDDRKGAVFSLEPTDEIKKLYQPDFSLHYTVSLEDSGALKTTLKVTNPSSSKDYLKFQTLLHTYLRLPEGVEPATAVVKGLKTLEYIDKVREGGDFRMEEDELSFPSEVDRVYLDAPDTLNTSFGIRTTKQGYSNFVCWNPAKAKSDALGDMEADGYKHFVCIEPGQAQTWFTLAPGEDLTCSQLLEVV